MPQPRCRNTGCAADRNARGIEQGAENAGRPLCGRAVRRRGDDPLFMQRCRHWKPTAGCWCAAMPTRAHCWKPGWKRWPAQKKCLIFGAMSYADAKGAGKAERKGLPGQGRAGAGKAYRVRQRSNGVQNFAAGCLERAEDTVLFLGSRKGCWVPTVANADTPALWLLDMIRRAASGLPQATERSGRSMAGPSRQML